MTTEMKMETRSLASLRPAEYNPRVQLQPADPEYQNIKRSIETFGYVDPIIIN
jgi:ParB-like chromosome segregation protein Spo0J